MSTYGEHEWTPVTKICKRCGKTMVAVKLAFDAIGQPAMNCIGNLLRSPPAEQPAEVKEETWRDRPPLL